MCIADVTFAIFPLTFLVRITSHPRKGLSELEFLGLLFPSRSNANYGIC